MNDMMKNKTGKARIKKWNDSYTVPIAYFGLMTLERSHENRGTDRDDYFEAWGEMEKVFDGIPIKVIASIRGNIEPIEIENTDARLDILYDGRERRTNFTEDDKERLDILRGNRMGGTRASYYFTLAYFDTSTADDYNSSGHYVYHLNGPSGNYDSVEEAMQALEAKSEQAFGEVMQYVNQEKIASTKKSKKVDKMKEVKKSNKLTKIPLVDVNKDDIELHFNFHSTGTESIYGGRVVFDAYASFMKGYDRDRMRGGGIREVKIDTFEYPIREALNPALIEKMKDMAYQTIMNEIDDFIYDEDLVTDSNPIGMIPNPGARFGNINGYEASTKKSKQSFTEQVDNIRNKTYDKIGKVRKS